MSLKFYVYKTTNNVNGKFYVGVHKSKDFLSDSYLGSGKILRLALDKYGAESFSKEVIASFDIESEAYELEEIIVDSEFIQRDDTYNLVVGLVRAHPLFENN